MRHAADLVERVRAANPDEGIAVEDGGGPLHAVDVIIVENGRVGVVLQNAVQLSCGINGLMADLAVAFQNALPFDSFHLCHLEHGGDGFFAHRAVENGFCALLRHEPLNMFNDGRPDHRGHDENTSCECFSGGGKKVGGGDNRVEREALIDGGDDLMVAKEDFVQFHAVIDGVMVFVEGIDPDERPSLIWSSAFGIKQMWDAFLWNLVGHVAVGVVDGEEIELRGRLRFAFFVDAADSHREVDVMGHAVIAVEPRGIEPPWVVGVVSERKTFAFREFRDMGHPAD